MLLIGLGQRGEAPLESDLRKGKCIEGLGGGISLFLVSSLASRRFPRHSHLPSCKLFFVAKKIKDKKLKIKGRSVRGMLGTRRILLLILLILP